MNGVNRIARSLAVACCVIGTTSLATQAQPTDDWTVQAVGSYESRIWTGGNIIPATTEFIQSTDGSLRGRYILFEPGKSVPGVLSDCQAVAVEMLRCGWQDQYGTGVLEVSFSGDFSQFNGFWGTDNEEPWLRWSGSRSSNP